MPGERIERQSGSFIVRIWWERGGDGREALLWRGWVQHVRTGNQTCFHRLDDRADFIEQELDLHPNGAETSQGLV